MISHDQLPEVVVETMFRCFGDDILVWRMLNRPFYPNRKPRELLCCGHVIKYKWHKSKLYVVEVIKAI